MIGQDTNDFKNEDISNAVIINMKCGQKYWTKTEIVQLCDWLHNNSIHMALLSEFKTRNRSETVCACREAGFDYFGTGKKTGASGTGIIMSAKYSDQATEKTVGPFGRYTSITMPDGMRWTAIYGDCRTTEKMGSEYNKAIQDFLNQSGGIAGGDWNMVRNPTTDSTTGDAPVNAQTG